MTDRTQNKIELYLMDVYCSHIQSLSLKHSTPQRLIDCLFHSLLYTYIYIHTVIHSGPFPRADHTVKTGHPRHHCATIGSQMMSAYEGKQRLVIQRLCAYVPSEGMAYH